MQTGDFVKVAKGNYRGYYAVITEESYGGEIIIILKSFNIIMC